MLSGSPPSTHALLASAEPLLVAVAGVLALVIVGLVGLAVALRRKTRLETPAAEVVRPAFAPIVPAPPLRARSRPHLVRRGGGGDGLAVATSSAQVCPTCRTEYHGLTYCTRDARRLVLPEEMLGGPLRSLSTRSGIASAVRGASGAGGGTGSVSKSAGLICMACRRAYEPGLRSCPHDGNELVSFPVYNATRPRKRGATEPAGVIARICPVCGARYDLNARFCGHDAGELVVIN